MASLNTITDPVFLASPAFGISSINITNWNTAFGWGNHALAGYATATNAMAFTNKTGNISMWTNDSGYLTSVATPTLQQVTTAGNRTNQFTRFEGVGGSVSGSGPGVSIYTTGNEGYVEGYDYVGLAYNPMHFVGSIMKFETGSGLEQMRITNNGDVGIGTTPAASYKLHVAGLGKFSNVNSNLNFGELDANTTFIQSVNAASSAGKDLAFFNTAEAMRILTSGNIGIGTTTPAQKLVISDGIDKELRFVPNFAGQSNAIVSWNTTSNQYYAKSSFAESHYFMTGTISSAERMRIDALGNIGIGVSANADARVDIRGGDLILRGNNTITNGGIKLSQGTGAGYVTGQSHNGTSWVSGDLNLEGNNTNVSNNLNITNELIVGGAVTMPIITLSGDLTLGTGAYYTIINLNTSGTSYTLTLPTASTCTGRMYRILDEKSGDPNNKLLISPGYRQFGLNQTQVANVEIGQTNVGGETVLFGKTLLIQSDGTNWIAVGL